MKQTMRSKAALAKAKAQGYGDVLCLREKQCGGKQQRGGKEREKAKAGGYGDVLCLRKCNAMKSNSAVESSVGKARAEDCACVVTSSVLSLVVVPGESGSSAIGKTWSWGCMLVRWLHSLVERQMGCDGGDDGSVGRLVLKETSARSRPLRKIARLCEGPDSNSVGLLLSLEWGLLTLVASPLAGAGIPVSRGF